MAHDVKEQKEQTPIGAIDLDKDAIAAAGLTLTGLLPPGKVGRGMRQNSWRYRPGHAQPPWWNGLLVGYGMPSSR
jgi:hypothetical protein